MIKYDVNNTQFKKAAYWLLMLTIFLSYWLFSRQYTGPAYLSDEIGYLTKAAAFAGYPVDMASSWHGGYSLILSPLFMIFSDPFILWQGIMVLNAVIWVFSFILLFRLLKEFFPERNFWAVFFAVSISAAYPAWITMSGYVFSTTGFVFIYMLSIFILLKSSANNALSIVPYSLLVGFLYWIHPTGLAVAVASFLAIAAYAWRYKRYSILIIHVLVIVAMMAIYKIGVHNWLSQIMTPENYPIATHYKSLSSIFKSFSHLEFWLTWIVISFSQLSYLLIATLGVCFFAVVETWKRMKPERTGGGDTNPTVLVNTSLAFAILSIIGIVLLGSLTTATNSISSIRPDQWIYGRYSEVALLPLLAVGLMAPWRFKYAAVASIIVLVSGVALHLYTDESISSKFTNLVNIQSFWPKAVWPNKSFIFWFISSAFGIILASVLKKKLFVLLAIPLFITSISYQNVWHKRILAGYSKPTSLVDFVTSNFQHGECIGFDTFMPQGASGTQIERRNLYSYYFFNYDIRRMSPDEWLSSCDGPYLTYRADAFPESAKAKVIAKELHTGLFLAIKTERLDEISIKSLPTYFSDLRIDLTGNNVCLFKCGFSMHASSLQKFMQAGTYKDGNIVSTGDNGFLFYGPYYPLTKGKYFIKLEGKFIDLEGAILDIVSRGGKNKHLDITLSEYFNPVEGSILIPFSITSDVDNIEIRLRVNSRTKLTIYGYSVGANIEGLNLTEPIERLNLPEPMPGSTLIYRGKDSIYHQVGTRNDSGIQTDGQAGYLMYGPYQPMKAGEYILQITGRVKSNGEHVIVDVVDHKADKAYARFEGLGINKALPNNVLLEEKIILNKDVDELEVRVLVEEATSLFIDGYTLKPIDIDNN